MGRLLRNSIVFPLVIVGFVLLLLLPKNVDVQQEGALSFSADYPFTFDLYKRNIEQFIGHLWTEKGFGETRSGVPLTEHGERYLKRSMKVIVAAFGLSMVLGSLLGVWFFFLRDKWLGKLFSSLGWALASIPDFFLFIICQYGLILLMQKGFPEFNLFSSDDWYSFIIPSLALTIYPLFHMIKMTLVTMDHESSQEYVRTVLSKGMTRSRTTVHIFWNALSTILNQSHMVLLYILSSLPIIEKLSNYNGAGYQLLESILDDEVIWAFMFFLPFLAMMFIVMVLVELARIWLLPRDVSHV
ncbi:ABC transporter permease subunit [Lentibacillus saliphilus]|uniref:ABC transporter permease subunit n=1 Tax=Lentibacillus saliphilus TaxID=2737028 RepID=UPI001C2F6A77|nr:ABC transporter permease subunit [Lentibacillus saliphilus]